MKATSTQCEETENLKVKATSTQCEETEKLKSRRLRRSVRRHFKNKSETPVQIEDQGSGLSKNRVKEQ